MDIDALLSSPEGEPGLVVGFLGDSGALRHEGGVYDRTPLPSREKGQKGPLVGLKIGRTFHGLDIGGMHTPETAST